MSYNNYDQYGGNPYQAGGGGYTTSDPYGARPAAPQQSSSNYAPATAYGGATASVGANNPYASANSYAAAPHTEAGLPGQAPGQGGIDPNGQPGYAAQHTTPGVVQVKPPPTILSNPDFLSRVESIRGDIRQLTTNVSEVGVLHQRMLGDPTSNNAQLDNLVSRTQVLNTKIRDEIRHLEADALKSGKNTTKDSQIRTLKGHFKSQLEDYQQEESNYRKRYQEQIAREYKIVNPDATDAEVQEAATADWGNEGIFQTALKSNRTATANSVLGNVRARHNDIQLIEKNMVELAQLFNDLAATVELQETAVVGAEQQTQQVHEDTQGGVKQLGSAVKSARNRRKLKWWTFGIVVLIIVVLALVLGLYFGLPNAGAHAANNNKN